MVLYHPTPLARSCSGTKSEANALPTERNIALVRSVKDKQPRDHKDVLRHGEAEIGDQEDRKRGEQYVFLPHLSERDPAG